MEKIINLSDSYIVLDKLEKHIISEKIKGGPKRTRIVMRDHDTGKILQDVENKIVITGSMLNAANLFGIDVPVLLPDYNTELGLDNTVDYTTVTPTNAPLVCLFCIGDTGCGTNPQDVFKVNYVDRIDPEDLIPFRYVNKTNDLNADLRKYYYGRKTDNSKGKIAYYFKAFDTTPQMHLRYTDHTQVTDNLYNVDTTQQAECYVEVRLRVTRKDLRDYIEQVIGWEKGRVSTISLCHAWYNIDKDGFREYQQIFPYTRLNFSLEWLVDLTKGIDFNYQIFY